MRIALIGGKGGVGSSLVEAWRGEHELTVLDRSEAPLPGVRDVVGEAEDPGALTAALEGAAAVVHLAAHLPHGSEAEQLPGTASALYGLTKRLAEQALRLAVEGPAPTAAEGPLLVTSLRLAYPTTAEAWPRWVTPLSEEQGEPVLRTLEDGTALSALHPEDLAAAVMAALCRERGESYEAIAVTAAAHSIADDSAQRLLGWHPRHVLAD